MKINAGLEAFVCVPFASSCIAHKKGGVDNAYQDALDKIVFRLLISTNLLINSLTIS